MQYDPKDQPQRRQGRKIGCQQLAVVSSSQWGAEPSERGTKGQGPTIVQSQETHWVNLFV